MIDQIKSSVKLHLLRETLQAPCDVIKQNYACGELLLAVLVGRCRGKLGSIEPIGSFTLSNIDINFDMSGNQSISHGYSDFSELTVLRNGIIIR